MLNALKFNLHKGGACNAYYVLEIWGSYSGAPEDSSLMGWSCVVGPLLPEVAKVTFTTLYPMSMYGYVIVSGNIM
jgi:hypothetical protein